MDYLTKCLACNSSNFAAFEQTIAMMHQNSPTKYNFDRCKDCGLVFLNPRMDETELGQFYTASYLPYRVEEARPKSFGLNGFHKHRPLLGRFFLIAFINF